MQSNRQAAGKKGPLAPVLLLLCVFLLSLGLLLLYLWEYGGDPLDRPDSLPPALEYDGKQYVPRKGIETFLVIGLDTFETETDPDAYNNDRQADFLLLLIYDHENQTGSTLHLNRDTMADVHVLGLAGQTVSTVNCQLALAHTYGNGREVSCRNTADAVSGLLMGVRIDHYMSVTMDGVAVFHDLVGGVELQVLDDFSGIDDSLVKGETVKLTGAQALTYVRARQGMDDSSNLARMRRQRQYLQALQEKTEQKMDAEPAFPAKTAAAMAPYLVSNCSAAELQSLAESFHAYDFSRSPELPGQACPGEKYMQFHPDPAGLQALVIDLFYREKK